MRCPGKLPRHQCPRGHGCRQAQPESSLTSASPVLDTHQTATQPRACLLQVGAAGVLNVVQHQAAVALQVGGVAVA